MDKRRRPKTAWEETKLGFYRNNKAWEQSIRSRKIVENRNGEKIAIHKTPSGAWKEIPNQPKHLWPEPKRKEVISYGKKSVFYR